MIIKLDRAIEELVKKEAVNNKLPLSDYLITLVDQRPKQNKCDFFYYKFPQYFMQDDITDLTLKAAYKINNIVKRKTCLLPTYKQTNVKGNRFNTPSDLLCKCLRNTGVTDARMYDKVHWTDPVVRAFLEYKDNKAQHRIDALGYRKDSSVHISHELYDTLFRFSMFFGTEDDEQTLKLLAEKGRELINRNDLNFTTSGIEGDVLFVRQKLALYKRVNVCKRTKNIIMFHKAQKRQNGWPKFVNDDHFFRICARHALCEFESISGCRSFR